MDRIIAAVRAAIFAIATVVWVTCKATGRLIRKVIPGAPDTSIPSLYMSHRIGRRPGNDNAARQVAGPTGAALAVKTLAQRMAAGTVTMQDMHGVDADVVKWMSQLDHQQLCRLICVERLGDYMAGRTEVRGLPKYLEMPPRPSERRTTDRDMAYTPIAALAI